MAFTYPPPVPYRSKSQTDAKPFGFSRQKYILPDNCPNAVREAATCFDQGFEQLLTSYPAAARNTPSNNSAFGLSNANAILTQLSQPAPTLAGMGQFIGTFAVVPATWDEFKMMPYIYPGFPGVIGSGSRDVGNPSGAFQVRVRHEYFVVDEGNILGGTPTSGGGTANAATLTDSGGTAVKTVYSFSDIPVIKKAIWQTVVSGTAHPELPTMSIVPAAGVTLGTLTYYPTLPTQEVYKSWILNARSAGSFTGANPWTSGAWDGSTSETAASTTTTQFVAEDCTFLPYAGNIVCRLTPYILAK